MDMVWIFNGEGASFPAAVFTDRELAEYWIKENRVSGVLTAYPLDRGVYDWCIANGTFTPKRDDQKQPKFIQKFSSASQEHYHYQDGISA